MELTPDVSMDIYLDRIKALTINNTNELNFIIDELNALDFRTFKSDSGVAQDVIINISQLMPSKNDHLLSKFCCVLRSFCTKMRITLNQQGFNVLTDLLISSSMICGAWVRTDVLFALSSMLYSNAKLYRTDDILNRHADAFLKLVCENNNEDLQNAALKCLQYLTFGNKIELDFDEDRLAEICHVILSCLKSHIASTDKIKNCKIILSCLRCLQNVYSSNSVPSDEIGEILGLLKALLYCGFPGQEAVAPERLYPSLISLPPVNASSSESKQNQSRGKSRKKRSRKKATKMKSADLENRGDVSDCGNSDGGLNPSVFSNQGKACDINTSWRTSGSESDFSDVEGVNILKLKATIRQHAYIMLHAVIKVTEKRVMFGFWSSFLPETASGASSINNLNIFTSILKDPSLQVRLSAITVLAEMMRASKQFFSLVDGRTIPAAGGITSFTTASSILTSMVIELHRCLFLALVAETSTLSLTQILKCYTTLMDNIPYKKLNADLLLKLIIHLKPLLCHKDLQVQVACLTVFGSIFQSDQMPSNVIDHLMEIEGCNCTSTELEHLPWIVKICKDNILNEEHVPALPILVESLQVLTILVPRHFSIVRNGTKLMEQILASSLSSEIVPLKLHGAKLFEVIGLGILNDVTKSNSAEPIPLDTALGVWQNILSGPFSSCIMNSECPSLRSVCCDCLSTLPSVIFDKLSKKLQVFCITLLVGLSSDEDYTVRGAALRCLGIYSLFPGLREDLSFLSDVARILCTGVNDSVLIVRTKASWAMGNLTDALFLSRDEYPDFANEVTPHFIHSIGMASIKAAEDNDRIQASAVRAIGNLLYFLPSAFLGDPSIQDFIREAQVALLSALLAKIMKVSWNACYAFGNVLKNKSLISSTFVNLEVILQGLMKALGSANFKVRINAVLALASLDSRAHYDKLFIVIITRLMEVLLTAESDLNFKEIIHLENLQHIICFCICHLMSLVEMSDFVALKHCTMEGAELLLASMWSFGQKAPADKISVVDKALDHVEELKTQENSDDVILELWHSILNQAKTASFKDT